MGDRPETHTYKTAGGCEIRADVHRGRPAGRPAAGVVWIHGGALIQGSRADLQPWQRDRYLRAGYTVVSIDYRLAPETKLPSIIQDIRDAWKWLRENGPDLLGVDPGRAAIIGHSAGGYLALVAGAFLSFYGYGDIVGDWCTRPDPFYCRQPPVSKEEAYRNVGGPPVSEAPHNRGQFYVYCRQHGIWPGEVAGRDPQAEPSAFVPLCPVRNISAGYPPTLLLHGEKDTDVPCRQSVMIAQALAGAGIEHELVTIPDGGHCFDLNANSPATLRAFERVMAFLKKHLGED